MSPFDSLIIFSAVVAIVILVLVSLLLFVYHCASKQADDAEIMWSAIESELRRMRNYDRG